MHARQKKKGSGRTSVIGARRREQQDTVRFAGLNLTPECAGFLMLFSQRANRTPNAVITQLLEDWARRQA